MRNPPAPDISGSYVRYDVPLSSLVTWGVGGAARIMFVPRTEDEMSGAVSWARSNGEDFFVLGGGSNVLISDAAFDIPVINTAGMSAITVRERGDTVYMDCLAGTPMKEVLALAAKNGWSGLECAAGIPGTVGGAVAGNAGSKTGSIGSSVELIVTVEPDGSRAEWNGKDIGWGYRSCSLFEGEHRIAQNVTFRTKASSRDEVARLTAETMRGRKSQPVSSRTAGCVFKNPNGESAGNLLDRSGCKGMSVGGARVSESHANFIENHSGSARDIMSLALLCRKKVLDEFGTYLDFEVKMAGVWEVCPDAGE
ncbi:MAG: UDP-N-acetylmuramate dehydrogenase [Synergistaceae bacterium]|jgi:UDP-N-acetylmuramate dehydrogenase|nr:UDP-N-acetylmuramate dehydrogenase [Synergistaceae bacterium]